MSDIFHINEGPKTHLIVSAVQQLLWWQNLQKSQTLLPFLQHKSSIPILLGIANTVVEFYISTASDNFVTTL